MNLKQLREFVELTKSLPEDIPVLQIEPDYSFTPSRVLRVVEVRKFQHGHYPLGQQYHVNTSPESFGKSNLEELNRVSELVPAIEVM